MSLVSMGWVMDQGNMVNPVQMVAPMPPPVANLDATGTIVYNPEQRGVEAGEVMDTGEAYNKDAAVERIARILRAMPGFASLYGHMTAIMYAAGVQPGTPLEKEMIYAGYYIVLMGAADIMKKAGMKEPNVEGMTVDQREAEMLKLYTSSNALLEIDAQVQTPEYAAKLRDIIVQEVMRRGGNVPPPPPPPTTGDGSTAKKIAQDTGVAYAGGDDGKVGSFSETLGRKRTQADYDAEHPAEKVPLVETGAETGKILGMDSKTFMIVAAGALVLLMSQDG